MPMKPELRRGIDRIRDLLFGGGYPNPAQNAEQLSFLIYFYMFEAADAARVRGARRPGAMPYVGAFEGDWSLRNPRNAREPGADAVPRSQLRWSIWANALNGEQLVNWLRDEVFPFHAELAADCATNFMDGARLVIDEPTVLSQVVSQVNDLRLEEEDSDTKGDLFEHVLRQIRQAGELGQFRTPRHVIRALVRLINPRLGETIYDPAAGTAGFLVGAYDHIRLTNSSATGIVESEVEGKTIRRGLGDMLGRDAMRKLHGETFFGTDVDPQMVRLATMNLTLRGLDRVRVLPRNTLTRSLDRSEKVELGLPEQGFDVILANPPFSGRIDKDRIIEDVKVGRTAQTELLFLQYMLNHLKEGGRCGVVVPEGVLFGSSAAHRELRRKLIENNTIEAVLSLPGGVFNPYSNVRTSMLIFRKGGTTERVMFLHADNDGYRLDANHDDPIDDDDLPDLIEAFQDRGTLWETWLDRDVMEVWEKKWWFADADAIRALEFNLSAGHHRPPNQARVEYRDSMEVIEEMRFFEKKILVGIDELVDAVREVRSVGDSTVVGYTEVPIGEVCTINPRASSAGCSQDMMVSFIPMAALDEQSGTIAVYEERLLAEVSKGYTSFEDGDILFAKITPCMENGKIALARNLKNGMGRGSTEFYVLRPKDCVLGEYLYYFIRQEKFREAAKRNFAGTAGQQRVSRLFMENALIPLPSLEEQRQIVDVLNLAAMEIESLRKQADQRLREAIPALFVEMLATNP